MNFLIKNLIIIHKGGVVAKIKSVFSLSVVFSIPPVLTNALTCWYFDNYEYICFVLVAILMDHFLGSWVHLLIKKDFF